MRDHFEGRVLSKFPCAVYDVQTDDVMIFDRTDGKTKTFDSLRRQDTEDIVSSLYDKMGFRVRNVNHKHGSNKRRYAIRAALGIDGFEPSYRYSQQKEWTAVKRELCELIIEHTEIQSEAVALEHIDIKGAPDLLAQQIDNPRSFTFIEVKRENERLNKDQVNWINEFDFIPVKIAKVFQNEEKRERFVSNNSASDILANYKNSTVDNERSELPPDEIAERLSSIEIGDRVVFNDRKKPCTVTAIDIMSSGAGDDFYGIRVKSARGTTYDLSENGDYVRRGRLRRNLWWVSVV